MNRIYQTLLREFLAKYRQMVFLMGPRQVGKTTIGQALVDEWENAHYFTWDSRKHRVLIAEGAEAVAETVLQSTLKGTQPLIVFDEIHKYSDWKLFLKALYDLYPSQFHILVTGSARLDVYKKGGDSLMGRYFRYRVHPLSVAEILTPEPVNSEIRPPREIEESHWKALLSCGGFPSPYITNDARYTTRWQELRLEQLVQEDIRDLTRIHELGQLELLMELLRHQVGQLVNYTSLSKKIGVSSHTIRHWIEVFKSIFHCYTLSPWARNMTRSLIKIPKLYLWDWSLCQDLGAHTENFIASHLFKAVHYWTDQGFGTYDLHYLRDKKQREVDFLVTKNNQPWFLVEVKNGSKRGLSKNLHHYQELTGAKHAFQVALDLPYEQADCFNETRPIIVPAKTFLSQLA